MVKRASRSREEVRIFIVEDHPVFREGLARLAERSPDWKVCGVADNAQEALAAIKLLKPNLVLVDISLPGRGGLELIKRIHSFCPESLVLVISMHDEGLFAERVLRAGGRGYIMKDQGPEKIVEAMQLVLRGQIYLSTRMSTRLLDSFSDSRAASSALSQLTDRQLEIFQLTGEGEDSRTIARKLNLSIKTVDAHRLNIKERLELKNLSKLISYAARWLETQAAPPDVKSENDFERLSQASGGSK
jgi:DNA-binding NarL/FixJ family response regulator